MRNFFKDGSNTVFEFTDEQIEKGYGKDLIAITEEEKEAIINPPKTESELLEIAKASMASAIQSHIDSQAKSLGYDGIVSACSYAGYTNEFQDEAIALGVWRSAVWTKAFQVQADVEAGTIPMPTVDELIAMLPIFGA